MCLGRWRIPSFSASRMGLGMLRPKGQGLLDGDEKHISGCVWPIYPVVCLLAASTLAVKIKRKDASPSKEPNNFLRRNYRVHSRPVGASVFLQNQTCCEISREGILVELHSLSHTKNR
jgi:hypothetical protein